MPRGLQRVGEYYGYASETLRLHTEYNEHIRESSIADEVLDELLRSPGISRNEYN